MSTPTSSWLKAGFQGGAGTGKTMTSALLLLGLSVERHNKAPVLVFDSEPGWQFVKPLFDHEGVPLIIRRGRHFKGLVEALREAQKSKCCGFAADSLTHPWTELLQSFADSSGRVAMHKFNQIKQMWNGFSVEFMDASLHSIGCGRLQWEMLTVEQEGGGYDLVRGDSKMKAGGGESFGYEPHLLVEFRHEQKRGKEKKAGAIGKLGGLQYIGFGLKDRSRALEGKELCFQNFHEYKTRGYVEVYQQFLPHLLALDSIDDSKIGKATSAELIPSGSSDWYRLQQRKKIALEEIEGSMTHLWPGQDARSKKAKASVIDALFKTKSWTKVESLNIDEIESGQRTLEYYEKNVGPGDYTDHDIMNMLREIHKKLALEPRETEPASRDGEVPESGATQAPPSEPLKAREEAVPEAISDPEHLPF